MKIFKMTKVVIFSIAILHTNLHAKVFVEATSDISDETTSNVMKHEEIDHNLRGFNNPEKNMKGQANSKGTSMNDQKQRDLGDFKCHQRDNCNPGLYEGKKSYCAADQNIVAGKDRCSSGWKPCQPGCNPGGIFNNRFWACERDNALPLGNKCRSGWKECYYEHCGGFGATCSLHTDCPFSDMFCSSNQCVFGPQPPTRSPTRSPTKVPTAAPTMIPTAYPSMSPTAYPTGFLDDGLVCTHSSQCYSRLCEDGVCKLRPYGADCSSDDQCSSSMCNTNVNRCDDYDTSWLNSFCTTSEHCDYSTSCIEGTCQYRRYGDYCDSHDQCDDDLTCNMDVNKCDENSAGDLGAFCQNDYHCRDSFTYVNICTSGKCNQGKKNVGASCSSDDECHTDICNPYVNECETDPVGSYGASCVENYHCDSSYICDRGYCSYP